MAHAFLPETLREHRSQAGPVVRPLADSSEPAAGAAPTAAIGVWPGDNITPPHQALGWIPSVYSDTDDLKRAGQRIVYLVNPHVGHLGIFVSTSVARLD